MSIPQIKNIAAITKQGRMNAYRDELKYIGKRILETARGGKSTLTLDNKISPEIVDELRNKGYKVIFYLKKILIKWTTS